MELSGLSCISVVLKELGYEEHLQKFQVVFIHLHDIFKKSVMFNEIFQHIP